MRYWYDKEAKASLCEPNCVDEWLWHIWAIGLDYDGCRTAEELRGLVDELVNMSLKARDCLYDGKLFEDKEESWESLLASNAERDKDTKLI